MNKRLEQLRTLMDEASIYEVGSDEYDWDFNRLQPYHESAALVRLAQFDDIEEVLRVLWQVDIAGNDNVWDADGEQVFYVPLSGIEGKWWLWLQADDVAEQLSLEEQVENALELAERLANPTCECSDPWCELMMFTS